MVGVGGGGSRKSVGVSATGPMPGGVISQLRQSLLAQSSNHTMPASRSLLHVASPMLQLGVGTSCDAGMTPDMISVVAEMVKVVGEEPTME